MAQARAEPTARAKRLYFHHLSGYRTAVETPGAVSIGRPGQGHWRLEENLNRTAW
jgi:hypothetical protein